MKPPIREWVRRSRRAHSLRAGCRCLSCGCPRGRYKPERRATARYVATSDVERARAPVSSVYGLETTHSTITFRNVRGPRLRRPKRAGRGRVVGSSRLPVLRLPRLRCPVQWGCHDSRVCPVSVYGRRRRLSANHVFSDASAEGCAEHADECALVYASPTQPRRGPMVRIRRRRL